MGFSHTAEGIELCRTTSSSAALNLKEVVAVSDLKNDAAWRASKLALYESSLSIPMTNEHGMTYGVLEALSKSTPFDSATQRLGQQIVSSIRASSLQGQQEVLLSSPAVSLREQIVQLAVLLNSLRTSVSKVVNCETACVYFVDHVSHTAITQKSEFSDCLEIPLEPDTLLGYAYSSKRAVVLPQSSPLALKDLAIYSDCSVLCIPVLRNSRQDEGEVQGLILLTRPEPFTSKDLNVLTRLAAHLSGVLDVCYSDMPPMFKQVSPQITDVRSSAPFQRSGTVQVSLIQHLIGLVDVSPKRILELKPFLKALARDELTPLRELSLNLRRLIPSQQAKLFLIDESQTNLLDLVSESLVKISGLTKQVILSKRSVAVNGSASRRPNFDKYCDSLGLEHMTETFLCVPILDYFNAVIGVMSFVNSPVYFSDEDVRLAEFLSLVPREFSQVNENQLKNWASLVKAERRHKSLQHWFKKVTIVSSNSNKNATFAKDILLALNSNPNAKTLFKYALMVVKAITNSEEASVVYKANESYTEYNKDGQFTTSRLPDQLIKQVLESHKPIALEAEQDFNNMLLIPLRTSERTTGVLKVVNKKDELTSLFRAFSRQDEYVLSELADFMGEAVLALSEDQKVSLERLYGKVKEMASSLNTYNLLSVIRTAAQNLLNCDRGTVFTREGDFLVVKAQALEQEVPVNFKIPVGSGIVGCVVQTGATEIVADAYQDPRFNHDMDQRTGYRTKSILCMPVKDSEGYVIAALQMINKRSGVFTSEDAELLEVFTEQAGSLLQSTVLFSKTLEESSKLYNILSSLGNNIVVLDQQGRLIFSNKPIEGLFGVSERLAKRSHFAVWLRENTTLVQDITQALEQPSKKIERQSQSLVVKQLMRSGTLNCLETTKANKAETKIFNYAVQGLSDLFSKKNSGAVLILEDASEFEALRSKFADMEIKIKDLTCPVHIETSLQQCLNQLATVSKAISSQAEKDLIQEVIESLQAGNLYSPKLVSEDLYELNADLRALRDYLTAEVNSVSSISGLRSSPRHLSEPGVHVELTALRDWNLNVFEIEHFSPLIVSMFDDFELFDHFSIPRGCFLNFIGEIYTLCEMRKNPFHNFTHCFTVMHSVYMLLVSTPAKACFTPPEVLALLVGALCHDVDHTGRGNAFEINKGSHLALLYHDKSVLEQHHAAVAFFTMQRSDCNILATLDTEVRKRVRQLMIAAILDTDMASHFRIIPEMKSRFADLHESPFGSKENDTKSFGGFLLHCSDLGHPAKDFLLCSKWSLLVVQEFSAQHREEVELGLPVTEFMKDLENPAVYYKNEVNFLTFVILPLWKCSQGWLGDSVVHCVDNVEANIKLMKLKLKEIV
jgi:GAF domain-containing protein